VQAAVPVLDTDTADTLAARVLAAEHRIYPLALKLVAEERVRIVNRRCFIDGAVADGVLVVPSRID
jgi:phosphoribosylglycinamide formyltransferase-1